MATKTTAKPVKIARVSNKIYKPKVLGNVIYEHITQVRYCDDSVINQVATELAISRTLHNFCKAIEQVLNDEHISNLTISFDVNKLEK